MTNEPTDAAWRWTIWCPCDQRAGVGDLPPGTPAPPAGHIVECPTCPCHHEVTGHDTPRHRIHTRQADVPQLRAGLERQGVAVVTVACAWCLRGHDAVHSEDLVGAALMCPDCDHPSIGVAFVGDHLVTRLCTMAELRQVARQVVVEYAASQAVAAAEHVTRDES
jgi:hypothetical protein